MNVKDQMLFDLDVATLVRIEEKNGEHDQVNENTRQIGLVVAHQINEQTDKGYPEP